MVDASYDGFRSVGTDDRLGGEIAARHVLDMGHRRVGFIGEPMGQFGFVASSLRERGFRDAHRKQHGCVKAVFTVEGNLPRGLQRSLFSSPSTYPALIRYSNGSGLVKDDHDGDGRGMAIKLLGVQGTRNLNESDDENSSQDFLLINHPVFFVRNAEDYVGFQKAVQSGQLLWWLLNPFRFFHEGMIAKAIQGKKMINPLNSTYWSMTASKLEDSQMKFRALPCPGSQFLNPSDSADRLSENLAEIGRAHV